jgi:hypothetical protein
MPTWVELLIFLFKRNLPLSGAVYWPSKIILGSSQVVIN